MAQAQAQPVTQGSESHQSQPMGTSSAAAKPHSVADGANRPAMVPSQPSSSSNSMDQSQPAEDTTRAPMDNEITEEEHSREEANKRFKELQAEVEARHLAWQAAEQLPQATACSFDRHRMLQPKEEEADTGAGAAPSAPRPAAADQEEEEEPTSPSIMYSPAQEASPQEQETPQEILEQIRHTEEQIQTVQRELEPVDRDLNQ